MLDKLDWKDAIAFMQKESEAKPDHEYVQLIWKKLQLGHRTQDIIMDVHAMMAIKQDGDSASPEWKNAVKWLTYQRAQKSDLMLDMLWQQLETGDRTPELLNLIRIAAGRPEQAPPPPSPIPEPAPIDNTPPSKDF